MVQLTTRDRVDRFWSSTLGVEPSELHVAGVRVRPNADDRAEWRGAYVLAFDDAVSVFVPGDLVDDITKALAEHQATDALEPETWRTMLDGSLRAAFGPVVHHYLDDGSQLPTEGLGRRINPRDSAALTDLRGAVAPGEWRDAGFTAQTAMMFALFDGDRMVAAANLTEGPDAATDIGLVIDPAERGKGYGLRIAATAAKQAIAMHGIARFRVYAASAPTLAIAAKLGFTEYGRNLAAYLH
jgi:GNAT superfamily N-acetyltransferase